MKATNCLAVPLEVTLRCRHFNITATTIIIPMNVMPPKTPMVIHKAMGGKPVGEPELDLVFSAKNAKFQIYWDK